MDTPLEFLTGSRFSGTYNRALHSMEGYGNYVYPDGSEYRGNFKQGKFHGYGQLVLAKPFCFTFLGVFENGKLMQLHDMVYSDGLHLKADFENNKINFDNWKYCSVDDRRFAWEILNGIGPTGQQVVMSNLDENSYDVGSGIYKANTGFIVRIPPPFFSTRFLSCDKEKEWILRNCRRGPYNRDDKNFIAVEPIPEIGKEILDINVKQFQTLQSCACTKTSQRKHDLLNSSDNSGETDESSTWSGFPTSCSTTLSSFSDKIPQITDLERKCHEEVDTLKLSFFNRSSVNAELFNIFQQLYLIKRGNHLEVDG